MILDESITDLQTLLRAWTAQAIEGFNLKINRVGGLTRAKLLRDAGQELGLRVNVEDSWGGDLTTAAVSHLAASTSSGALTMVSFMNDWTNEHIAGHEPRSVDGFGTAPTGPGLGVSVDSEQLGKPFASFGRRA
jgi:cis-L-3-hydroxyproline dehydratase